MAYEEGTVPVRVVGDEPRRVAVFVDYWWVYSSARQVFGGAQPPPAWFGNVTPAALARVLVKHPPASVRRSQRVLAGLHIFVRSYDPELHHSQHERVLRWEGEGATVEVGPQKADAGGGFWQSSVNVALATAVVDALARGACDTAVVFAGDPALLPLIARVAGPETPSSRLELATWVAPDGTIPTTLAATPGIWCHRLGEATYRQVTDDRRAARKAAVRGRVGATPRPRRAPEPPTAMAAAFAAATGSNHEHPAGATAPVEASAEPPPATPDPTTDLEGAESPVRRLTHRLFGRGA